MFYPITSKIIIIIIIKGKLKGERIKVPLIFKIIIIVNFCSFDVNLYIFI